MPAEATRVGIVVAMVPEARPIVRRFGLRPVDGAPGRGAGAPGGASHEGAWGGRVLRLTVTSMGTTAARAATEALLDATGDGPARGPVDHVIVVGICGGVDPADPIGSLVVPAEVCDDATGRVLRPHPVTDEAEGRLLTTDQLYRDPADRARLAARGIRIVDMETAAVGAVCEERGVAWSVLRAVSDPVGDPHLDAEILGLSNPDGSGRPGAALAYVARRPHRVPKLVALGRGMNAAVRTCTDALDRLLGGS